MITRGLYEQLVNKGLKEELENLQSALVKVVTNDIDNAEAPKVLAKYIADIFEQQLKAIQKEEQADIAELIQLSNKVIDSIFLEREGDKFNIPSVDGNAKQLMALIDRQNTNLAFDDMALINRPETSLTQSSLFTGAKYEPCLYTELLKEIGSCNEIDILVSFIKWSGLRLIINNLRTFAQNGGKLRVITTSYMGATDIKAIEELYKLPNTIIKVSYDTKRTRLHAKSYLFYRDTGFSTAYIGSSNLSHAAISSGLEWNIKLTAKDQPETINKMKATFESYWNSSDFEHYSDTENERLSRALRSEQNVGNGNTMFYSFSITPYKYQKQILDKLDAERKIHGQYRNLIVAATGTGKTVISAFDYKRFRQEHPKSPCNLLFIAHREEILTQSIACFRGILKDQNFGSLFVGNHRPDTINHLFMSVQTFNSQGWHTKTSPDFYDYIIIDEFHHAAAPSYQTILMYYQPKILLGLTATPERMDGGDILTYFNNRIAAEIRLPEAIDRKLLCPFQYFGISDTVDLKDIRWSRGGYDRTELSKVYTMNGFAAEKRCNMIIDSIFRYVSDIDKVKGLGFCVSVVHAEYMSNTFNNKGIPSIYLTGNSPDDERNSAKDKLVRGDVRFIFVVDLYNEGVDIPEVNTVLFLRPTESLTVFLQQLGRGLRLAEHDNKECLTVLDYVGQANKKYNFEEKFRALLSDSSKGVQNEIKHGFMSVPKGCFIQLEKKAKEYILQNIKASLGARNGLITRMASFEEDSGLPLTLANFVRYYHLDIRTIYVKDNFSRLSVLAGIREEFYEPLEDVLTSSFSRICAIDSRRWLKFLLETFDKLDSVRMSDLSKLEERMLQMFQYTVWQKPHQACGFATLLDGLKSIKQNRVLYQELIDLLNYNYDQIDIIDEAMQLHAEYPLDIHCTYTRDQILVGMDYMTPNNVVAGVLYLENKNVDLLFVTLNKSEKDYSPSAMFNDYSINETLFHWQSQNATAPHSNTGQRYINHQELGSKVLLFVREFKKDLAGTLPYTFLGVVNYVSHEGSNPMNITWRLEKQIPAKFMKKTNTLMVG